MSAPPKRASLRQGTADAAALPNYVSVGAGAVAGVVELMTMYPLGARAPGGRTHTDVVKTRLQLEQGAAAKGKPHGMLRMMAQIVRQEGCVPYPRAHSVCTSCTEASSLCWYSRRPSVRSSLGRLLWRRCADVQCERFLGQGVSASRGFARADAGALGSDGLCGWRDRPP